MECTVDMKQEQGSPLLGTAQEDPDILQPSNHLKLASIQLNDAEMLHVLDAEPDVDWLSVPGASTQ